MCQKFKRSLYAVVHAEYNLDFLTHLFRDAIVHMMDMFKYFMVLAFDSIDDNVDIVVIAHIIFAALFVAVTPFHEQQIDEQTFFFAA